MRATSSLTAGAGSTQNQNVSRFIAEQRDYRSGKQGGDEWGNKQSSQKQKTTKSMERMSNFLKNLCLSPEYVGKKP